MCLPNENVTELLEFCYTEPRIWIPKGTGNPLGISEKDQTKCLYTKYSFAGK